MFFTNPAFKETLKRTNRPLAPKKWYYSEVTPLCSKNQVEVRRQKVPGSSCTQELQALFGCLKKWEFDDLPCSKLHGEYMRCVEASEKAAEKFKQGARQGILGEGSSSLSTAQFNKIMQLYPQPDMGNSQRRMKRLPTQSYADDLFGRKNTKKPN
uniref:CHCH domain-containing protein n=1 Tax=Panagrellus redivivus TaxID=6233 RepID=A0A7E4V293_PANRE